MEFKTYKLGDICTDVSYGYTASATDKNTGVKFLRITDISRDIIDWQKVPFCEISDKNQEKYKLLFADIVVARTGNTGESHIFASDCNTVFASYLIRFRINSKIANPFFIWLQMRTRKWWNFINSYKSGSVQSGINATSLRKFEVDLPSIDVQNLIVECVYGFYDKIHLNHQINQTLEQMAQLIFKSWFVDFDPVWAKVEAVSAGADEAGAIRSAMAVISGKTQEQLDDFQTTNPDDYQRLYDTAKAFPCEMVDGVPLGWEIRKVGDIIQKIPTGKRYSQKTVFDKGSIPVLDQGKSEIIGFHNDEAGVKASIDNPVIVFANHTCYMRLISYDFSTIQNVFAFRGLNINIHWLYMATVGKQKFTEYKGHFPDFLIQDVVVSDKVLMDIFGNTLKNNFDIISVNDRENETLSNIRDIILPKLLNGEIEL